MSYRLRQHKQLKIILQKIVAEHSLRTMTSVMLDFAYYSYLGALNFGACPEEGARSTLHLDPMDNVCFLFPYFSFLIYYTPDGQLQRITFVSLRFVSAVISVSLPL